MPWRQKRVWRQTRVWLYAGEGIPSAEVIRPRIYYKQNGVRGLFEGVEAREKTCLGAKSECGANIEVDATPV